MIFSAAQALVLLILAGAAYREADSRYGVSQGRRSAHMRKLARDLERAAGVSTRRGSRLTEADHDDPDRRAAWMGTAPTPRR